MSERQLIYYKTAAVEVFENERGLICLAYSDKDAALMDMARAVKEISEKIDELFFAYPEIQEDSKSRFREFIQAYRY